MTESRPVTIVTKEWRMPVSKDVILKIIEEQYGKNLLSLKIDSFSLKIEYVE